MTEENPNLIETVKAGETFFKGVKNNWTSIIFVLTVCGFGYDHFREPSVVGEQLESHGKHQAHQNWEELKPTLVDIDTTVHLTFTYAKENRLAIQLIPGGASALKRAIRERITDSINNNRWSNR